MVQGFHLARPMPADDLARLHQAAAPFQVGHPA
jgi:EAL domain-containing protein (putative c-di-GMP-specific phosphodiesterase class I)